MPELIDKNKLIGYLNAINPCKACSAYGEGAIDVIQHTLNYLDAMPTVPDVNRAEILRLCNEIEDFLTEIDKLNNSSYLIDSDLKSIRNRLKAIGKELTGDAGSKTD